MCPRAFMVIIQMRDIFYFRKYNLDDFGSKLLVERQEILYYFLSGLKNFYYLPNFHDMCYKVSRISEIISI